MLLRLLVIPLSNVLLATLLGHSAPVTLTFLLLLTHPQIPLIPQFGVCCLLSFFPRSLNDWIISKVRFSLKCISLKRLFLTSSSKVEWSNHFFIFFSSKLLASYEIIYFFYYLFLYVFIDHPLSKLHKNRNLISIIIAISPIPT